MRSQIIITVEHGEDTDSLQAFIDACKIVDVVRAGDIEVVDYEVKVDIEHAHKPDFLVDVTDTGVCPECGGTEDKHFLSCSFWPHNHNG